MSKPWSKLKKELVKLWDESLDLDIHQAVYRMESQRGSSDLPRYFITLDKEIIFDFPKDFKNEVLTLGYAKGNQVKVVYPYEGTVSQLSNIIREYIDTPKDQLLTKEFAQDFGLTLILKVADKRIGKNKLKSLADQYPKDHKIQKLINKRLNKGKTNG